MIKLMKNNKNVLLWEQVTLLSHSLYCKEIEQLSPGQLHNVLGRAVTARIMEDWRRSKEEHASRRRAYYFSAEFLMGRMVGNNLYALGIRCV